MKKIFSVILAMCMILSGLTVFSYAKTTYKAVWALNATIDGTAYDSSDTITVTPGQTIAVTLKLSDNYKTGPLTALIYYNSKLFDSISSYEFNTNGALYKTCGSYVGLTDWSKIHSDYKNSNDYWPNYSDATKLNSFKNTYHFAKLVMSPNATASRTPAYAVNENLITMNFKVSSTATAGSTGSIIIPIECMRSDSNPGGQFFCGIFKTNDTAGEIISYSDSQTFDCSKAVLNFKVGTTAKLGDVNKDSKINSSDALLVLQSSVGTKTLTAEQKVAADVNKDSKVNSTDALKILQYSVGQIKSF